MRRPVNKRSDYYNLVKGLSLNFRKKNEKIFNDKESSCAKEVELAAQLSCR